MCRGGCWRRHRGVGAGGGGLTLGSVVLCPYEEIGLTVRLARCWNEEREYSQSNTGGRELAIVLAQT